MSNNLSDRKFRIILIVLGIVAGCLVVVAAGLTAGYFLVRPAAVPTLIPTPTAGPTLAPTPTQADLTDPVWERIQANGKMVVGTSVDYPPFSYYSKEFLMDGYDIALIREIGRRLGIPVELKDMAFEGLGNALQLGQAEVAIAALSVTPERDAIYDFTSIYFVSEDAFLAREDSSLGPIVTLDDIASLRVGVQRGSIYETWLRTELVQTGKMPPTNLFTYIEISSAIEDLRDGRIDIVALDLQPANLAVQTGDLKLVGQGLYRQSFAIMIPSGAVALQANLDSVLLQMQNDGSLAALAQKYMGLTAEDILPPPTPTPGPTATPPPSPTCVDGMEYVADLNLNDSGMTNPPVVPPGQPFQKGWRIRNIGTCTWDSTYHLVYVGGNLPGADMGGVPTAIVGAVAPGQEYDMWVDLVSPVIPGTYQAFWQMTNTDRIPFGERVYVGIRIPAPPQPTPAPTQTASPFIVFTADPTSISAGEAVLFSWLVENASEVYFYEQGDDWRLYRVPPQDQREEYPHQTTIYELRVVLNDGAVEVRQIRIEVTPVPGAPVITVFDVEPSGQIDQGQCVDITWTVQGDVNNVRLTRNADVIWNDAPTAGATQDCPPAAGEMTYAIEATGPGGSSRRQEVITVLPGEQPPTQATATEEPQPTQAPLPEGPDSVIEAPAEGTVGEPVIFDGSGSTSDAGIQSYVWTFGDGSDTVEGAIVEHAYTEAGQYTVVLTVTDVNGAGSTTTWPITIN